MGANHFSKLDEYKQYLFGLNLYYYDQPLFFTRIPGPYQNVILYILLRLTNTVLSLYLFMAFLGTATIYFQYCLVKKVFHDKQYGDLIALLSSLLMAVMPWPVKFSTSYWNPNFIIPLTTLLLCYLYEYYFNCKKNYIIGIIVCISLMPFFHMIVLFIIPVVMLFYIDGFRKKSFLGFSEKKPLSFDSKNLLIAIILVILIYSPFLYMDFKNSFYIFSGYFSEHSGLWSFKPETLKIISNPIIVSSTEISRFIGHSFEEYQLFMNKYFGYYILGLGISLSSIVLFFISLIYFFKNYKRTIGVKFLSIWLVGSAIAFLIMMNVHEERYTIIWFPVLYTIIPFFIVEKISVYSCNSQNKKQLTNNKPSFKNANNIMILTMIILLILSSLYINGIHFFDERKTNYATETRLTPSLIFYEKVKVALLQDYLREYGYDKEIYKKNKNTLIRRIINDYSREDVDKVRLQHSLHSLFSLSENQKLMKKFRMNITPVYYLSPFFLSKINNARQLLILETIINFCNINMNLIQLDKGKAYFVIYFIDKTLYRSDSFFENYPNSIIISELPDLYIVKCKNNINAEDD